MERGYRRHRKMFFSPSDVFDRCEDRGYAMIVVPIVFVTPGLVQSAKDRGLEVWSYDSDDPRDLEYCADCGVTALIVDKPNDARRLFPTNGGK